MSKFPHQAKLCSECSSLLVASLNFKSSLLNFMFMVPCITSLYQWMSNNDTQQYAVYFILVQDHTTCFRCCPRPSSGVHKTVVTATGTSHMIMQLPHSVAKLRLLQFYILLMMGGWHLKRVEWSCSKINWQRAYCCISLGIYWSSLLVNCLLVECCFCHGCLGFNLTSYITFYHATPTFETLPILQLFLISHHLCWGWLPCDLSKF